MCVGKESEICSGCENNDNFNEFQEIIGIATNCMPSMYISFSEEGQESQGESYINAQQEVLTAANRSEFGSYLVLQAPKYYIHVVN